MERNRAMYTIARLASVLKPIVSIPHLFKQTTNKLLFILLLCKRCVKLFFQLFYEGHREGKTPRGGSFQLRAGYPRGQAERGTWERRRPRLRNVTEDIIFVKEYNAGREICQALRKYETSTLYVAFRRRGRLRSHVRLC